MRTETEIKKTLKDLGVLNKIDALTNEEKHGMKILEWVLGKDFAEEQIEPPKQK